MKTYCIVGTGGRSWMYINALMGDFKEYGQLLAFCDLNQARMTTTTRKSMTNSDTSRFQPTAITISTR